MTIDIKKTLLTGTALVAVGAFVAPQGASAQTEIDGTSGSPTDLTGVDENNPITNETDDNSGDFGKVNADAGGGGITTVGDADGTGNSINNTAVDGTLFIFDGDSSGGSADTLILDPV